MDALRSRLRGAMGDLDALHGITVPIAPPPVSCATPWVHGAEAEALRAEGASALLRGELAAVVLAGGMATRFGSVVKALSPMGDGGSNLRFLDAKKRDLARWGGNVQAALMTSFATHDAIAAALAADGDTETTLFSQFVGLRLSTDGGVFLEDDGEPSPYATGHGDLSDALAVSGLLEAWRKRGVRTILMSNVDNIGATVDPALYALHRRSSAKITVELVRKREGDRGGLPVRLDDGRLVLAEAFRLPKTFPDGDFPLFNTNTLWIDLDALDGDPVWTWCAARKKVQGRDAVQFERLVGELTWWNPTHYVQVPREGASSRFIPIKEVEDLVRQRAALADVMSARVL